MSVCLRVILLIVSILAFAYIARKLRKAQLQVMDAFFWICLAFVFVILGIFPQVAIFFADIIGIQSPVNFVFLVVIFLLLLRSFLLTIRISWLEERVKNLVEEIAIRESEK